MPHDPRKLLEDMRMASQRALEFTQDISLEMYSSSALIRSAVERQFTIIGEALIRLRRTEPALAG